MRITAVLFASTLLGACVGMTEDDGTSSNDLTGQPEPPMLGKHLPRGDAGKPTGGGGNPDLIWHSGAIMNSTAVTSIFWGTKWADPTFTGDKVSGMDQWYAGVGGSQYMGTNTEYTGTNGQVGSGVTSNGHLIDTSAAPSHAPKTSDIQNEVCKMITNPVADGYYPVYVDTPRGHAGYCAWHSYGTCNGVPVQFGFFFNLDGDSGCDPQDTSGLHSQGLSAIANVSGHELSEMVTDPRNGGWWDSSGNENGDKCAWTFNKPSSFGGTSWKIQGNWSNAAYDNGQTGYTKGGCIDGN